MVHILVCLQGARPQAVAHPLGPEVPAVAGPAVHAVPAVAARGRVQPLVARGAGEARAVPRVEGRLDLLGKVDRLVTLGAGVATSPPRLHTTLSLLCGLGRRRSRGRRLVRAGPLLAAATWACSCVHGKHSRSAAESVASWAEVFAESQ